MKKVNIILVIVFTMILIPLLYFLIRTCINLSEVLLLKEKMTESDFYYLSDRAVLGIAAYLVLIITNIQIIMSLIFYQDKLILKTNMNDFITSIVSIALAVILSLITIFIDIRLKLVFGVLIMLGVFNLGMSIRFIFLKVKNRKEKRNAVV